MLMIRLPKKVVFRRSSVIRRRDGLRPSAWSSDPRAHPLQSSQGEDGILRWPHMRREAQNELTVGGKRLYQGNRVGLEHYAGSKRRCGRRDLHGLAAVDTIGDGVVIAAVRDGR